MAALNKPVTGYGLRSLLGSRFSYSWASINGIAIEHGQIRLSESAPVSSIQTTAYNGYTWAYAECTTLKGSIDGYVAADDGTARPAAFAGNIPSTGIKVPLIFVVGASEYQMSVYLDKIDIESDSDGICLVKIDWTSAGVPTRRNVYACHSNAFTRP